MQWRKVIWRQSLIQMYWAYGVIEHPIKRPLGNKEQKIKTLTSKSNYKLHYSLIPTKQITQVTYMYLWPAMSSAKKPWPVYTCISLSFCIWITCESFNWFSTSVNIFCSSEILAVASWSLAVKEFMASAWFVSAAASSFRRLFNSAVLASSVLRTCVVVLRSFCNTLFLAWDLCSSSFTSARRFDNALSASFCPKKPTKNTSSYIWYIKPFQQATPCIVKGCSFDGLDGKNQEMLNRLLILSFTLIVFRKLH